MKSYNMIIAHIALKIPRLGKHTMYSEKLFLWLQSGPGSQQGAGTKSSFRLLRKSGDFVTKHVCNQTQLKLVRTQTGSYPSSFAPKRFRCHCIIKPSSLANIGHFFINYDLLAII